MDEDERARQRAMHEAIEAGVADRMDDGEVLASWLVIYETAAFGEDVSASCGHFYGPEGMTTWRALGLLEWARTVTLRPDDAT